MIITNSCSKDKAYSLEVLQECDSLAGSYRYQADIAPIIRASCATGLGPGTGCHDAWILTYSGLKSKIDNGTLQYRVFNVGDMPVPNNSFNIPPLTQQEKDKLRCWILTGALDN